ncbi:HU family DNA-binding protein [Cysteiniphilum litorale]|uniref:HU family DNA-binding protein n=1 Tax=Cysteiniphilum litorale TaxID=2056700 RepID=UPI003F88305D
MSKKAESKSYKKDEFVALVSEKSGLNKTDSAKALDAVWQSLEDVLAKGDSVSFVGYGSFSVSQRAAREGRNPKTGEKMKIKASNAIKFSSGKKLKDAVNK